MIKEKKQIESKVKAKTVKPAKTKRKISKTVEAARRLKGSIVVLDPTLFL